MIRALLALLSLVFAIACAADPSPFTSPCDMNGDGRIDLTDLQLIRALSGTIVTPGALGDANGDGVVNVADVRYCQLRCTSPNCATH